MRGKEILLLCLGVACLPGCGEAIGVARMSHDEVRVPTRFRGARVCVGDISDHERYVRAYEEGWWDCVRLYVRDIDYITRETDRAASGWPSAVEGYADGFREAEGQIKQNIEHYGRKDAREALRRIWEYP